MVIKNQDRIKFLLNGDLKDGIVLEITTQYPGMSIVKSLEDNNTYYTPRENLKES